MSAEVPENTYVDATTTNTTYDDTSSSAVAAESGVDDNMIDEEHTTPSISSSSSSSPPAVAKSLSALLSSVIQDFDSRAEATISSQDQLAFALDRLTTELDQLLDDASLPFIMQHAARISSVRKRVTSLNSVLKSIQRRVDNIDRVLSTGVSQEKVARESSGRD